MKSLYESILSSTKAGKYQEIDEKYLLSHGYIKDTRGGGYRNKEYQFVLRTTKAEGKIIFLFDICIKDTVHTKVISNVKELEVIEKWYSYYKNGDKENTSKYSKEFEELEDFASYAKKHLGHTVVVSDIDAFMKANGYKGYTKVGGKIVLTR